MMFVKYLPTVNHAIISSLEGASAVYASDGTTVSTTGGAQIFIDFPTVAYGDPSKAAFASDLGTGKKTGDKIPCSDTAPLLAD